MKNYKAIFIDWDDTIGDWSSAAYQAQRELYKRYNLRSLYPTFEEWFHLYHEHNNLLWDKYGNGEITKEYLQRDRFLFPLRQTHPTDDQALIRLADQMGLEFLDLTNHYFRLIPDAEKVIRRLAERYPLTVVSNGFVEVQYYKLIHSGLRDCFRHIVLSEEVGVQKPDPEIFRIALKINNDERLRMGEEPLTEQDVLMIGDGYGSDIKGAIAAHIDQLWLCPDEQSMSDETRMATYKTRSLSSVPKLLGVQ